MYKRVGYIKTSNLGEINGLKINFNVEKSLVGYPNKANIKIYNLKKSSRNALEEEGTSIELYAGYEDTETVLLFKGDIINAIHIKQSTEWITEVYALDGYNALKDSVINKGFPAGTSVSTVYDELVNKLEGVSKGITQGLAECISGKRSFLRSIQLSGSIKEFLEFIKEDCGVEYSINDGVMETTQYKIPLTDEPTFIINQNSGMIGSPEKNEQGITVRNHLLPNLKLGRRIEIKSISTKLNIGNAFFRKVSEIRDTGVYMIIKLVHVGDTRDNQWETIITGRNIDV